MQKKNVSWLIVLSSLILAKCGNTVVSSSGSSVSSEGTSSSEKTSTTSSSSVDSSSSKEATYKAIADSTITNGTVAFDKTSYLPLDIVTITVTPNEGYYLSGITLDDSDVPLTTVTEGTTYTFVMPAKDVTVNATFVNDYHVTSLRKINWGTYIKSLTLADGTTEVTTDTTFKAGETVTLNVYSGTSFDWSGGFYYTNTQQFFLNVNDETYTSKLPDDFVHTDTKSNVDHFVFSFVMPAKNVDLYVTYNNGAYISDTGYQVNVQADAGVKLLGFDPNAKYSYVSFFVLREDNTLVSIQYQYKNQTAWNDLSLNFDYTSQQYFTDNISSTSSITISSDTTVKATAKEVSKAAINYVNDDKVTFTSNSGTAMTQALPGDRVNMTYTIKDQNNVLLETTLTGIDSTHLKNNQIKQLSFDMPENPITITFNYVEGQKVTFVDNDYVLQVKGVRRSLTDSTAYPTVQSGKEFYLFVDDISLDTGKLLTGAKLNGGDIVSLTTSYSGKYFTFKMPETGTAEITLLTANAYNVSVISVTGGTLYLSSSDKSFGAGASINGTYYAESLYSLTSIALLNAKDADITSAITSLSYKDGSFSFIMPSYSVQIKPTWTKQESYSVTVDLGSDTSKFGNTTTGRSYVQGLKNYGYYYFPADKTDTAVSFGKGEQITMSVKLLDATVIPIAKVKEGENVSTFRPDDYFASTYSEPYRYTFAFTSFFTVNSDISISFELETKKAVKATINNPNSIALTYSVNGKTATDFSNVMPTDKVSLATTASAGTDKAYGFEYFDTNGNAIKADYQGTYLIMSDFSVNIVTYEKKTVTVVNFNNYNVSIHAGTEYTTVNSGDKVLEGKTLSISAYKSDYTTIHVKITNGDTVFADEDSTYYSGSLVVSGDVIITLTAVA